VWNVLIVNCVPGSPIDGEDIIKEKVVEIEQEAIEPFGGSLEDEKEEKVEKAEKEEKAEKKKNEKKEKKAKKDAEEAKATVVEEEKKE
ncbi:hypothetical protein ACFLZK_02720, partial [Patescibacteria group bacterium]